MLAALAQRKHPRLGAHRLAFGPAGAEHLVGDLLEINPAHEVHLPGVDLEDLQPSLLVRVRELHLAVDPPGPEQRVVEDVDAVRGHDHLDVLGRLEAVELVEQLEHGPLHLGVAALLALHPAGADRVDLVHEDDGGGVLPGHDEELAHQAAALADVLLHELAARDADEAAVRVVRHRPGEQRLAGPRRAVEQHALRLGNAEGFEDLGVLDRQLDDLLDLLDLLVHAPDHLVGAVGRLLHAHQLDQRVDLGGQDLVEDVAVAPERDADVGLAVFDFDVFVDVHDVLALLPDLHEDLLLPHRLDDLAAVRGRLEEQVQLLLELRHPLVALLPLRVQALLVEGPLLDLGLELLYLHVVVSLHPSARVIRGGWDDHFGRTEGGG
mmetsp:Transcript_38171/g.107902  ORF Transcript_38171/g.107902 Transcript_38171/m.107902 type:complete len:380 (+) Transcript_38171:280-1419(+)